MSAAATPIRVGLLLPSTSVTLETELPALLARHHAVRFTLHSSRVRLQGAAEKPLHALPLLTRQRAARLTFYGSRMQIPSGAEEIHRTLHRQRERCVAALLDTARQMLLDGCLATLLAQGPGAHRQVLAAIMEQVRTPEAVHAFPTGSDALLEALLEQSWDARAPREALVAQAEERMHHILGQLRARFWEALTWRFLRQRSLNETEEQMGLTEANVKFLQWRALKNAALMG